MTAGLRVVGDHGLFQVDETTICLSIMAQGTLASASHSYDTEVGIDLYTISYTGEETVFGLYLPLQNNVGGVYRTAYSGGVWTVTFAVVTDYYFTGIPPSPSQMHWFAFGRPKPLAGSGAGLRVWDAAGKMTFSSDWETVVPTFSFTSGRKYAGIGGRLTFRRDLNSDQLSDLTWVYHAWQTIQGISCYGGAPFEVEYVYVDDFGPGTGGGSTGYAYGLVRNPLYGIDVTGHVP